MTKVCVVLGYRGSPENLAFLFNIFAVAEVAMSVAKKRYQIEKLQILM